MQTALGLLFVVLGIMHFTTRDRHHRARSFYLNALSESARTRGVLATIEVAIGIALLLTA